jgi:hypothetical protein
VPSPAASTMTAAGPSAVTRLGSLCVSVRVPVLGPCLAVGVSLSESVAVTVSKSEALWPAGLSSSVALSRSAGSGWLQQKPDPTHRLASVPDLLRLCRVDAGTTPSTAAPRPMAVQPRCHSPDMGRIPACYPPAAVPGGCCVQCGACHDRATNPRVPRAARPAASQQPLAWDRVPLRDRTSRQVIRPTTASPLAPYHVDHRSLALHPGTLGERS